MAFTRTSSGSEEKESSIVSAICEYLEIKHHFFWRQNTGGMYSSKGGFYRKLPKHSLKGVPDIIAVINGRFVGLEVKRPSGRQSPGQKEFQEKVTKAGGSYHIVRSIYDVMELGL